MDSIIVVADSTMTLAQLKRRTSMPNNVKLSPMENGREREKENKKERELRCDYLLSNNKRGDFLTLGD